jgi:hypothetical protein
MFSFSPFHIQIHRVMIKFRSILCIDDEAFSKCLSSLKSYQDYHYSSHSIYFKVKCPTFDMDCFKFKRFEFLEAKSKGCIFIQLEKKFFHLKSGTTTNIGKSYLIYLW